MLSAHAKPLKQQILINSSKAFYELHVLDIVPHLTTWHQIKEL